MQFTDLTFLFIFLPVMLCLNYIVNMKYRPIVLILLSLFFYACISPAYFGLFCVSVILNLCLVEAVCYFKRKDRASLSKISLALGVLWNLGCLGFCKYINFAIDNVNRISPWKLSNLQFIIPVGISFFTFKALSLLFDANSGKVKEVTVLSGISYLSFFGHIQSGPISRYDEFTKAQKPTFDFISRGIVRFMVGFSKKVILADVLNNITLEIFDRTEIYSTPLVWLGAICYSLQLYYDFSGYSDMAIGICNMLGIDCCENFNEPYSTASVSEFWRRWHMSLGSWFRDYIYIPMGGSRVSKPRLYLNLFAVWFLTGLWHVASWKFVIWGLGYFLVIVIEKTFRLPARFKNPLPKAIYRIAALLFINFQWVIFRAVDFRHGLRLIKKMCLPSMEPIPNMRAWFLLKDYGVFILVAFVFATPLISWIKKKCGGREEISKAYEVVSGIFIVCIFAAALSFIISGQNNPFLYGNF